MSIIDEPEFVREDATGADDHHNYWYFDNKSKFKPCNFNKLRKKCLSVGKLFEDPQFPAADSSLFHSRRSEKLIEWKRPFEISENPEISIENFYKYDLVQGELGKRGIVAALDHFRTCLKMMEVIMPEDQSFKDNYAGIFRFTFWHYGRGGFDIVIDDRLPTYQGKLMYLHSVTDNDFGSALLEKAFAKLHGSYEALKGITTYEAIEEFTGGVTETYHMKGIPPDFFDILLSAYQRTSLFGCSIEPEPNVPERETPEGLIRSDDYGITCVTEISRPDQTENIRLIKLRNLRVTETKWNGPWSNRSPEWNSVSDREKEELGFAVDEAVEFWISFEDFKKIFTRLVICIFHINDNSQDDDDDECNEDEEVSGLNKKWVMRYEKSEWVRGVTAGGCRNFLETFCYNRQYIIELKYPDEDDENCTVIVGLTQGKRQARIGTGYLAIGFIIYRFQPEDPEEPKALDMDFFKKNASVARSPTFINQRQVCCRFKLPLGSYCIIPSTFVPNEERVYSLRVFTQHYFTMFNTYSPELRWEMNINPSLSLWEENIRECFNKFADDNMTVDCMELKEIMNYAMREAFPEICSEGLSKDICRSMIAMLDIDHCGKLGFEEFETLWSYIKHWTATFKVYDTDGSGCLSAFKLGKALKTIGYEIYDDIIHILATKYAAKDGSMAFDDYLMGIVRVQAMINSGVCVDDWECYWTHFFRIFFR